MALFKTKFFLGALLCLSVGLCGVAWGDAVPRNIGAQIATDTAIKGAAEQEVERKKALEDAKEARARADYKTEQEKLWEAKKHEAQRDGLMENARQNSKAAEAATNQPKETAVQQSKWKPEAGHKMVGEQVHSDSAGNLAAKTENGNVYYKDAKTGEWSVKPAESVGFGEGTSEVSSGGKTWEMTGRSVNGNPEYRGPNGNEGVFKPEGQWLERSAGRDYYTQSDTPQGFKAGENGRLVSEAPVAPRPDIADLKQPSYKPVEFTTSGMSKPQPVLNNGKANPEFLKALGSGNVQIVPPQIPAGQGMPLSPLVDLEGLMTVPTADPFGRGAILVPKAAASPAPFLNWPLSYPSK